MDGKPLQIRLNMNAAQPADQRLNPDHFSRLKALIEGPRQPADPQIGRGLLARARPFTLDKHHLAELGGALFAAIRAETDAFHSALTIVAEERPGPFPPLYLEPADVRDDFRHTRAMMGRGANASPAFFLLRTTSNEAGSSCPRSRVVGTVMRNCEPLPRRNLPTSSMRSSDRWANGSSTMKKLSPSVSAIAISKTSPAITCWPPLCAVSPISVGDFPSNPIRTTIPASSSDLSLFSRLGSSISSLARAISARAPAR